MPVKRPTLTRKTTRNKNTTTRLKTTRQKRRTTHHAKSGQPTDARDKTTSSE